MSLKKDYGNIALLVFLYVLQGLPLGLTSTIPFILSSKKASYADQGTFSFAFWPFSIKLLWAPLVDSIYVKTFGRRKSWLVPVQYMIGIFMFIFADYVHDLLEGRPDGVFNSNNEVLLLTVVFFMFTLLCATQDIVVDGWALTMLSKENVGWASTCNTIGQSAGFFISKVLFSTLQSPDFSNNYVRPMLGLETQSYGVLTFKTFMNFFGLVFIFTTTFIMLFKKDREHNEAESERSKAENDLSVLGTYKLMWKLVWLRPVTQLIVILLTHSIGLGTESINSLKLIEFGVPRENLSLMYIPTLPLQIILPLLLTKYTNGPRPLSVFFWSIPGRLTMSLIYCLWVYVTPYFKTSTNEFPTYYYVILFCLNVFDYGFWYGITLSEVSFFSRISDEVIGATYITFLNTVTNLGKDWPSTLSMYALSYFSIKQCVPSNGSSNTTLSDRIHQNLCANDEEATTCVQLGGECVTKFDAFYVIVFVNTTIAVLWLFWRKSTIVKLQKLQKSEWKVTRVLEKKE